MNIINLCNSVVEPRCAYTQLIYYPLVLKNVLFTNDDFCSQHREHAPSSFKMFKCNIEKNILCTKVHFGVVLQIFTSLEDVKIKIYTYLCVSCLGTHV